MTTSEVWTAEAAERYDDTYADLATPEALAPVVDFLADLAGGGAVLEFAAGTGRIALPLAARGVDVHGVDLSAPMIDALRRKDPHGTVTTTVADMATVDLGRSFSCVFVAFNSLANLCSQQEQVACFRNAARHLEHGGSFVVELWIPEVTDSRHGRGVNLGTVADGHVCVDRFDPITQVGCSHHYVHVGDTVEHRTMTFRYAWPSELDLMAGIAGLEFAARYADWDRSPVTDRSPSSLSVWTKSAA